MGVFGVEEAGIGSPINAGVETTISPSVQVVEITFVGARHVVRYGEVNIAGQVVHPSTSRCCVSRSEDRRVGGGSGICIAGRLSGVVDHSGGVGG